MGATCSTQEDLCFPKEETLICYESAQCCRSSSAPMHLSHRRSRPDTPLSHCASHLRNCPAQGTPLAPPSLVPPMNLFSRESFDGRVKSWRHLKMASRKQVMLSRM